MLPIQTSALHAKLFQPWQPASDIEPTQAASQDDEYLTMPAVDRYQALTYHMDFNRIKTQFLTDIRSLKNLSHAYVGKQYDSQITTFYNKLDNPSDHLKDSLLPLYRDTRFHIHRLVLQLKQEQKNNSQESPDPRRQISNQDYIASVLHECLTGINLCPAGIHSRFTNNFLNLEAAQEGLAGKLFKTRKNLFHQFVESFLFQQQREGQLNISTGMEVHWYNALHNLYSDALVLTSLEDPFAPRNLSDELIRKFLSAAPMHVNEHSILKALSTEWSELISTTLQELGVSEWITEIIAATEITSDRAATLDSKVFKPVNSLLQTKETSCLDLWNVIDETGDGNYCLNRYPEKLMAWVTNHFCDSDATVFAIISAKEETKEYIGTIGQVFFWVFTSTQTITSQQNCAFNQDEHTTLLMSHLTPIAMELGNWPELTCHALLTQAMAQTNRAEDIASFFLSLYNTEQTFKIPEPSIQILANLLTEKVTRNTALKEKLCECVCDHLVNSKNKNVQPEAVSWLINTPLLETVLLTLQQRGMDISLVTETLSTWQVADFSQESIKKLFSSSDCQRLFRQAFRLKQAGTMSLLLLTEHCDQLAHLLNNNQDTPLHIFALSGNVTGVQYLLKLPENKVNHKNKNGWTPLNSAAHSGHWQCVQELLTADGILVNEKNNHGWSPLNSAARSGHWQCVQELLTADDILVNEKNNDGWSPLNNAACAGHWQCVQMLVARKGILVNEKNNDGWTPLNAAAYMGHWQCIRELLSANDIQVNEKNSYGFTPLNAAAYMSHWQCIRELLSASDIQVNEKNSYGFTPLSNAAKRGYWRCVQELLAAKNILVNEKDSSGWTPLHYAACIGHWQCVRELLKHQDIRVNQRGYYQHNTALMLAIKHQHIKCINLLIQHENTNINKINFSLDTALTKARRKDLAEIVTLLEADPRLNRHLDRLMRMLRHR